MSKFPLLIALFAAATALAAAPPAPTAEELALARQFVLSTFEGAAPTTPAEDGLNVIANHGPVQKNARGAKPLNIAGKEYTNGLYCHAFSQILVRLPSPGETFTAVAGVDSNENTRGGGGSVVFSVSVGGESRFLSGVMREGASQPVNADLAGAMEFILQAGPTADGIACDQADWADAKVKLRDGRELWLADLPLREMPARPPFSAQPPFSFLCDGQPGQALLQTWELQRSSRPLDARRTAWTLVWRDAKTGLQARLEGIEYRDFATVEWTVHWKNTGTNDSPLLAEIQGLDTQFHNFSGGDPVLHSQRGDDYAPEGYMPARQTLAASAKQTFAPSGGRPTSIGFPYFNVEWNGGGTIVVVSWQGQWSASFARDAAHGLRVTAGQELTKLRLHPGEEIRTPLIVLQFWKGDRLRAQNLWRRWMLAHNLPRVAGGQLPPPMLSSCGGGFFPGIQTSEAGEKLFIDRFVAEKIGLDYWWLDAGWYPDKGEWQRTGTWEPDPERYPRGLRAVADHAHAKGLKLIVWFEPERVGDPESWLAQKHPDWLLGGALLNLGHPEARAWAIGHFDKLLTDHAIDLYRQDYNIDPLPLWRANDAPERQGLTEIRHCEGYLAYWDELRRRHPGMLIDSCASGGRRNDLESLRRSVPLLRSDYQSFAGDIAYSVGNQGHTFGLASWIPYFGQGSYYNPAHFDYNCRSYFSPAYALAADARRNDIDWALIRKVAHDWRQIAPMFYGDFYPLTAYNLDVTQWMAWQFDRPENGDGMVQAFRREQSIYEVARLPLRGLEAGARYRVTDLDAPEAKQEYTGAELMHPGLAVTLKSKPGAALLTYQRLP